jgi:peptidyl-prolyl cis-trans isomerase A (cyclophilin A)
MLSKGYTFFNFSLLLIVEHATRIMAEKKIVVMNKMIMLIISALLLACNTPHYKEPHVLIVTRLGEIEMELYPGKAPKTVAAFLSNIKNNMYNEGSFYRVLKSDELPTDFNTGIIQGGTWGKNEKLSKVPGIVHESTKQTGLSHTDGIVSMARQEAGSATTEFFICIGDQSSLDYGKGGNADTLGFAAFGKVFSGMDIVRKIQNQHSHGQHFDEPIKIEKIKIL